MSKEPLGGRVPEVVAAGPYTESFPFAFPTALAAADRSRSSLGYSDSEGP